MYKVLFHSFLYFLKSGDKTRENEVHLVKQFLQNSSNFSPFNSTPHVLIWFPIGMALYEILWNSWLTFTRILPEKKNAGAIWYRQYYKIKKNMEFLLHFFNLQWILLRFFCAKTDSQCYVDMFISQLRFASLAVQSTDLQFPIPLLRYTLFKSSYILAITLCRWLLPKSVKDWSKEITPCFLYLFVLIKMNLNTIVNETFLLSGITFYGLIVWQYS